jgi:hypothetical protein
MDRFGETTERRARTLGMASAAMLLLLVVVALFGAAGASASLGEAAVQLRAERLVANRLAAQQLRAERIARVRALAEARRRAAAERRAAEVASRARRATATQPPMTPFGTAEISCTSVTFRFRGFPATGENTVREVVFVEGEPVIEVHFTFTGETGTNTLALDPEAVRKGTKRIDAFAGGRNSVESAFRGFFDIRSTQQCGDVNEPAFAIEKTQAVIGSGTGYREQPITAEVGQTIEYRIKVTNIGNTVITFGALQDPNCDAGTLHGGEPGGIVSPSGAELFICTHTVTPGDLAAGSFANVATITGTPNGSEAKEQTSNTVVAEIRPPGSGGGGGGSGPGSGGGGNGGNGSGSGTGSGSGGAGTGAGSGGVAGTTSSSSFLVRVRSRGVKSVVIYIDGHRMKTLTARAARRGYFSVRINVGRLAVGRHRLQVRITMEALSASRHHIAGTRSLSFLRCASAALHPNFTG